MIFLNKMYPIADLVSMQDALLRSEFGEYTVGHKLSTPGPDGSPQFFQQAPMGGKPVAWFPLNAFDEALVVPQPGTNKPVPIAAAYRILEEYDKDEVIIISWEGKTGYTHVTTAGTTMDHKRNAAEGGQHLEAYLEKVGVIDPRGGVVCEDPFGMLEEGGADQHPAKS